MTERKMMPIMGSKLISEIPWPMIAPHEKQARSNHSQSLERLAERGGLGCSEAIDIMRGARWGSAAPCLENERYLVRMVANWTAEQKDSPT
jgi:hypothetical protein